MDWLAVARRVEELGFDSLLVPDNLDAVAPVVANAAAAAVTERLTRGSLRHRHPAALPRARRRGCRCPAPALGRSASRWASAPAAPTRRPRRSGSASPFGSPAERMAHLEQTITAVRERTPDVRITVAASGPRMLALAGRTADVVALGASPFADEDEIARMGRIVTDAAAAGRPAGRAQHQPQRGRRRHPRRGCRSGWA